MATKELKIQLAAPFITKKKKCNIDRIVVQEVLEYLPPKKTIEALNNWRRYLKVGGEFCLIFPDFVKATFLYKRNTISYEILSFIVRGKTLIDRERIENFLLMRYSTVMEVQYMEGVDKKLYETILIAKK